MMIHNKKIKDGVYSNDNETFEVNIQDEIAHVKAITNCNFLGLKKGQSTSINKNTLESFLNEELFNFNK